MTIKTYHDVIQLSTFEERFEFLRLRGEIGLSTFGFDRYLNQAFYTSSEWRRIRNEVIVRDNGCDLACEDRPIFGKILIHHINPISQDDILNRAESLLDPMYLVCVSHETHNALHYGDISLLPKGPTVRMPGDTVPWRH